MGNKTIYPQGIAEINVPATESIAISNYGGGIAKIYYLISSPNRPDAYQFQQTLENGAVTLGAFSVDTIVKIEANGSKVIYEVATAPNTGIGDADTLGGNAPAYYTNADNISSGTLAAGRLPDTYAADNDVVHNTGNEIVSGVKTFAASVIITTSSQTKLYLQGSLNPFIEFDEGTTQKGYIEWNSNGWVGIYNVEDGSRIRIKDDLDFSPDAGVTYYSIYHEGINPSLGAGNGISGTFTTTDAKTVTVTNGIITSIV